jgi:hypothetical protein
MGGKNLRSGHHPIIIGGFTYGYTAMPSSPFLVLVKFRVDTKLMGLIKIYIPSFVFIVC